MTWKILYCCFTFVFLARLAVAELTLHEAFELARGQNRALATATARVSAQKAVLRAAKAKRWPSVELNQRLVRLDESTVSRANSAAEGLSLLIGIEIPPFVFQDSYRTQLDLAVPLWTSGALAAKIGAEREGLRASQADRQAMDRSTQLAVVRRFFDLAATREVRPARQEALRLVEGRLSSAEHRLEVGLTTRQEVLRWKVEVERAIADLADLEADELVARLQLADVLNVTLAEVDDPALAEPGLVEALLAWAEALDPSVVLERATMELDGLPEARAAHARAAAASEQVRGARSARRPRLDAALSYGWLENDSLALDEFTRWSGSLLLRVPLDLRGDLKAEVARGLARQSEAEIAIDDARASLRLQLGRALADVVRSRARLRSSRRAEEESRARRELLARQAGVGTVTLLDLVDADSLLAGARVARALARVRLLESVAVVEIYWPGADPPGGGLVP